MADIITKKPKSEQTKQNIIDTYLKLIPSKCWDKITVKECSAFAMINFALYDISKTPFPHCCTSLLLEAST